jgi:hypothetical protein
MYSLFVTLDANFRLKNQLVSSYTRDPGLGTGLAYFVPTQPYNEFLLERVSEKDVSRSLQ